nr:MAG TPA: hypothetical protein [Caudoviricetes sp.]
MRIWRIVLDLSLALRAKRNLKSRLLKSIRALRCLALR